MEYCLSVHQSDVLSHPRGQERIFEDGLSQNGVPLVMGFLWLFKFGLKSKGGDVAVSATLMIPNVVNRCGLFFTGCQTSSI
jgi:hypothetical protein